MFDPIAPSPLQLGLALVSTVLFVAAVVEKRLRTARSDQPASTRSWLSLGGIAFQTCAFFIVSIGPVSPTARSFAPASLALALVVLCTGSAAVWLFRSSAEALGDNWSLVARTRTEHSLVTHGPFAMVRHPIYLAMLLLLHAIGAGFGHVVALLVGLPLFLAGTAIRTMQEEKLLTSRFGDAYRAYARQTPALIPRLL